MFAKIWDVMLSEKMLEGALIVYCLAMGAIVVSITAALTKLVLVTCWTYLLGGW